MPSRRQADRARASRRLLLRAERRIDAAVLAAIDAWLTAVRFHLFRELGAPGSVQAAAFPHGPHIVDAAVQGSYGEWRRQLDRQVIPSVSIEFSEAFQQARRRDPLNSYRYQQQYIEEVSDRLKIWPEGAFEDIRPELMEALAEGESIDEIRDRVGRVLNIDARTRAIRATIHEVEQRLEDPDLDSNTRRVLNARRRELWEEHDESLGEWQWKARRIARTEAHGAVQAGKLAAAQARAELDPDLRMWKRWLATEDTRTRATHRVADGQTVPLTERFRVGGFLLDHPADAITIAPHEVINCRCDLLIYDDDELQDELQGPDGSMGEIRPGGVRIGPDDPDEADRVIAEVAEAEGLSRPARLGQRGEDRGQSAPAAPEPVELTDDREKLPPSDRPTGDLSRLSDDQLLDEMQRANDTGNQAQWDAAEQEWERRHGETDSVATDPEPDTDAVEDQAVLDWLTAEDAWRSDVADWLAAETDHLNEVSAWLAAEQEWLADPLPGLKRKFIGRDLTVPLQRQFEANEDFARTNLNYSQGLEWRINCQRVVQALELRRRGYDVVAQSNDETAVPPPPAVHDQVRDMWVKLRKAWEQKTNRIHHHFNDLWRHRDGSMSRFEKLAPVDVKLLGAEAAMTKAILDATEVGARGWTTVDWINSDDRHIFSWEVVAPAGVPIVRYYDAQNAQSDAASYFATSKNHTWMRVDNLVPTDDVRGLVDEA